MLHDEKLGVYIYPNRWKSSCISHSASVILKKSDAYPSVKGPSTLVSAKISSFRAPLLLTVCQPTCFRTCLHVYFQVLALWFIGWKPLP